MKISYDGEPKNKETEIKVADIIEGFTDEGKEYTIGIDYAPKHSKDFTAITRFSKNEDGTITIENVEHI